MAYSNTRYKYGFGYTPPKPPPTQPTLNPTAAGPETYGVNLSATNTQGVLPVNQPLADAYSYLHPTWTPPSSVQAQLPSPISPVVFNPELDPGYAAAEGTYGYTDAQGYHPGTLVKHAQDQADYLGHQYGQQYGYDASGNLITSGPDLNPYAQAAILKRNYDSSVRGTDNSYASQGQLYSGARVNAQHTNDFNYGVSSDQLKRTASGAYNAAGQSVTNAQDTSIGQLASLVGPAFSNFLAGQRGS